MVDFVGEKYRGWMYLSLAMSTPIKTIMALLHSNVSNLRRTICEKLCSLVIHKMTKCGLTK